ncbi:hypothetical protein [Ruminiclostridium cellobioparum]|uniref:hypothetical protein n=1 Tax=Ruminiclostridium cellobioparum TaxID=29355 RepID=UPI0006877DDD|nr:hypothetical protein [Ruminiclostridium cellobioparum]
MGNKKTTIGAGVVLDGEKEFKQAITEINNGLKVTTSELMLVTARFSDNAKSMEALTAKSEVLENTVNGQREKILKLREALAHSATTYGEADSKTMKWQVSLNKAETELVGMERELEKTSKEIDEFGKEEEEAGKKTSSFGDKINNLVGALGINLPAGAQEAIKALDGQRVSTLALIGVTAGIITGFAKASFAAADFADDILTLSAQTGISTDTLQELKYAAEFVDASLETMTGSMTKMIRTMASAQAGNKEASAAFRQLHLSITNNGKLKDSEQMFYEVIDALGKMRNETERDALAMQIFGKSAQELNPLIEAGSGRLKELGEEAQKLGIIISSENLDQLGQLKDHMDKLNAQTGALKLNLGLALAPALIEIFEILNKMNPRVLATVAIIGSIAVVAITVVKSIADITSTFSAMTPVTFKTTMIILGVVAALIALAAIIAVITGKGDELNRTMASVGSSVGNMTSTVNNAGNSLQIGRNASGTNNWRGGYTWVNEEGGEIMDLPRGTRIIPHDVSMEMARTAGSSSDIYNFQPGSIVIDAKNIKEFNDIVKLVKGTNQASRVRTVMG